MRIAGVRVSVPAARLLSEIVADAGFPGTARTLADAIEMQALEPSLTIEDHEAMLAALAANCPTGLARLRRELLDQQRYRWKLGGP
jgi:DNA-binding FadR family transcriptional regulator